ncbi:hypothetical protein [Pikeienuella sp. HZG-20]|uniref:hypothetical protein n=1 Tax=Paludibacillus litoralis TaxID=3133267 RepID=UPI0030EE958C
MQSEWFAARSSALVIALATAFLASFASAHGTGRDHTAAAESAQDQDAFDGIVIERRLTGVAEVISVPLGGNVQLHLTTSEPTELHLHGYDLTARAGPQTVAVMTFHAVHAGRFPIASHGADDLLGRAEKTLAYIEILPE